MKVFCLYTDKVEGFSFTNDIDSERASWVGSPVTVIEIGDGSEEDCRNCSDYLAALKRTDTFEFDESLITFTEEGLNILNGYK